MAGGLGIVAGAGDFPVELAERCRAEGRTYCIVRLKGSADPRLDDHPGATLAIGRFGAARRLFKAHGCDTMLFCGWVKRPGLFELGLDWAGFKALVSGVARAWGSDDPLMRAVLRVFEQSGIAVKGPADIWPDLLAESGMLTERRPTDAERADVAAAAAAALEVGRTDRGQGAVARDGVVIAREDRDHTDGLLRRVGAMAGTGGALAKLSKPHQDRRMDLPVIGPETVASAARAGLAGIAVEAGGAIIARRTETLAAAAQAGLFIVGLTAGEIAA